MTYEVWVVIVVRSNVGEWRRELKKRAMNRVEWWLVWAVVGLLVDEYVKEGYWFRPEDLMTPVTHEFLIMMLVLCLGFVRLIGVVKKKRE